MTKTEFKLTEGQRTKLQLLIDGEGWGDGEYVPLDEATEDDILEMVDFFYGIMQHDFWRR